MKDSVDKVASSRERFFSIGSDDTVRGLYKRLENLSGVAGNAAVRSKSPDTESAAKILTDTVDTVGIIMAQTPSMDNISRGPNR